MFVVRLGSRSRRETVKCTADLRVKFVSEIDIKVAAER